MQTCPLGLVYRTQLDADLEVAALRRRAEQRGDTSHAVAKQHVNHWHVFPSRKAAARAKRSIMPEIDVVAEAYLAARRRQANS